MSDPIGTQGIGHNAPALTDADRAARGGLEYQTRLDALTKAKDRAEKALEQLALGKDAVAMHAEAKTHRDQARSAEAAANDHATRVREEADAYAASVRREADEYAARVRAHADAVHLEAITAKREAENIKTDAATSLAAAQQMIADA